MAIKRSRADEFVDAILQHEKVVPFQTPLRITSPEMRGWQHIKGYPVRRGPKPAGRENFFFVPDQRMVPMATKQQFMDYITQPNHYGLSPRLTVSEAINKFDQTGAPGKLEFMRQRGFDPNQLMADIFSEEVN